jgi:AraC family transcriptional regulator of adaptative response / DNA-3-methyladenine glycosylase II
MLDFLAVRQLPGVECVATDRLILQRTVRLAVTGHTHTGWLTVRFDPPNHRLLLHVSDSLQPVLPQVIWRVRELLDLDADPQAINTVLHPDFPTGDGLRVPGCFDGFELAVRAVLGQQITVAAARTLATRLLERFGEPISTPDPALHRLFPSAQTIAQAEPQALGELGIVRQRQQAILALSRAVASGELDLSGNADLTLTTQGLLALPGIGPWTAQYIALRALRWPDAWPVGDVAVHQALGLNPNRGRAAEQAAVRIAAAWRPWRSYAVIRAWAGCQASPAPTITPEVTP